MYHLPKEMEVLFPGYSNGKDRKVITDVPKLWFYKFLWTCNAVKETSVLEHESLYIGWTHGLVGWVQLLEYLSWVLKLAYLKALYLSLCSLCWSGVVEVIGLVQYKLKLGCIR